MNKEITCKTLSVTPSMKQHIDSCLSKLEKLDASLLSAHVIVEKSANHIDAEAKLLLPGTELFAKATHEDFQIAMNRLTDKLKQQITRYRGKLSAQRSQAA